MINPGSSQSFLKSSALFLKNRYRGIQHLGSGGFGSTFLAEDTHMPSKPRCVIKHLRPVYDSLETAKLVQQAFEREAVALEELSKGSRSIPDLYAYFKEDNCLSSQYYIVQEYIEGYTVAQYIKTYGVVDEKEIVQFLQATLEILVFLKQHNIIHRDIKPDNIILRPQKDAFDPVLIDFGAIKESVKIEQPSQHTQKVTIVGTPGFMPLEQLFGNPDFSSDIYALGMTAIFMLTGKWPEELIQENRVSWEKYCNASDWMTEILNTAIARNPCDRYPEAISMIDALNSEKAPNSLDKIIYVLLVLSCAVTTAIFVSQV